MRARRVAVVGLAGLVALVVGGCGGASLNQSTPEGAAQSVLRLIADEKFEAACDGVTTDAPNQHPVTDSPEDVEWCLEAVAGIHAYWDEHDLLGAARGVTVSDELSTDSYGEQVAVAPGVGDGGEDLLVGVHEFDGDWYAQLYYAPSA